MLQQQFLFLQAKLLLSSLMSKRRPCLNNASRPAKFRDATVSRGAEEVMHSSVHSSIGSLQQNRTALLLISLILLLGIAQGRPQQQEERTRQHENCWASVQDEQEWSKIITFNEGMARLSIGLNETNARVMKCLRGIVAQFVHL